MLEVNVQDKGEILDVASRPSEQGYINQIKSTRLLDNTFRKEQPFESNTSDRPNPTQFQPFHTLEYK